MTKQFGAGSIVITIRIEKWAEHRTLKIEERPDVNIRLVAFDWLIDQAPEGTSRWRLTMINVADDDHPNEDEVYGECELLDTTPPD